MFNAKLIKEHDRECEQAKKRVPKGEWTDEPNRVVWKAHGMQCLMSRHPSSLHWCGYVGLEPGHPDFGKTDSSEDLHVDVHGGITYGRPCAHTVCHKPEKGEPDELHWLGFDMAHLGDLSPSSIRFNEQFQKDHPEFGKYKRDETYKNLAYVKAETESLAKQLAERKAA